MLSNVPPASVSPGASGPLGGGNRLCINRFDPCTSTLESGETLLFASDDTEALASYTGADPPNLPDPHDRAIEVVHPVMPWAWWGPYRMSMMTDPGWRLFDNTMSWLLGPIAPADARVAFFTYSGSFCPTVFQLGGDQEDQFAAWERMVNVIGFDPNKIDVYIQTSAPYVSFANYDLVVYINSFGYSLNAALNQGKPIFSTAAYHAAEMGIGSDYTVLHNFRGGFWVRDVVHPITAGYVPGRYTLRAPMWIDAVMPTPLGVAVIGADHNEP